MNPTPEESLRISRHLLLSSPPGQFELILSDLRNILTNITNTPDLLTTEQIDEIRNEYDKRTLRRPATSSSSSEEITSELHEELNHQMENYIRENYSNKGVVSTFQITRDQNENSFAIILHSERINLKNCNAGSWSGNYNLTESGTLTGVADVHAHCFENGNVQLRSKREFGPFNIQEDLAKGVLKKIDEWEVELMNALEGMYGDMSEGMLKRLRRVLPVSKVRMDWNVNSHRFIKTLSGAASAARKVDMEM